MKTLLKKFGIFLLIANFAFTGVCMAVVPDAPPSVPVSSPSPDAFSKNKETQSLPAAAEEPAWSENKVVGKTDLKIISGNSHVIHFNREVGRVAISAPDIADVAVVNKQEVLISTKMKGAANLLVWDKAGDIYMYNVTSVGDPTVLKEALAKIAPQNKVDVFPTEKGYVVRGNVDTVEMQKQIAETSQAFSKDSASIVTVNEAKQILLEIRIIEISRSKDNEFSIDGAYIAEKFGMTFMPGGLGPVMAKVTDDNQDISLALPEDGTKATWTGSYHSKNWFGGAVVRLLENESFVKVLAKPNILVRDGSKAHLLVGGEFPIPQVTSNTTDVTYKEYGTKLTYTPSILDNNRIRFDLQTEISELDQANGIIANGFNIPAITSRKANTVVEINNDTTFVIGGIIADRNSNTDSGVPGFRKIPLLGKLFSSKSSEHASVELVIFITPHIVDLQKESFDLKDLEREDPLFTLNEIPEPPFEIAKALAMEEYLTRYENERKSGLGISDRTVKRNELRQEYLKAQEELRERREAEKADALAYKKALAKEFENKDARRLVEKDKKAAAKAAKEAKKAEERAKKEIKKAEERAKKEVKKAEERKKKEARKAEERAKEEAKKAKERIQKEVVGEGQGTGNETQNSINFYNI